MTLISSNHSGVAKNVNRGPRLPSLRLLSSSFPFPLLSLPFLFLPFPLSTPFFFLSLLPLFKPLISRTLKIQLKKIRQRCKLPSGVWGSTEIEFGAL